ncbi:acyl-CoA dehydrogenase family protein [Psychromarinibacter sp. C21-152]|uniref:Acyl-CoA dehydrogenase family protein n=1 Tax=Psychromarinibacter sediminicola TaxID=3033385 RepID=A0AAE3TBC7_9RHOB|nr:acyl-CoA dehydrogenase family protein [Psychromarinibacter sediminicola]MDF0602545.1 acyl-CoA dehydrogenase family protein [Psychromarinibacter sediminicola]
MTFTDNAAAMREALLVTPDWPRVAGELDAETVGAILTEAAKVAEGTVAPLNPVSDRVGASFEDGRVTVPPAYGAAYDALAEGGWLGLEHPEALGGMGMPLTVFAAVNPLFERACPSFMMSAGGSRAAALLLSDWADDELKADWVPALVAGERCATICISEPEAGSDVGRIRTRAEKDGDGWRVTGQKIWISFGDHDLRDRIGHCMLARTGDAPGTRGLSLFFVERGAGVTCTRIEEKLGLHGSPTCALQFDGAPARLIGEEGRGLPQLFTMIRHMRLTVATQGLGMALAAYAVAKEHAEQRRQGGDPKAPAVPIVQHPDVRRQLLAMSSRIDLFRLALLEAACTADLSDEADMARLNAWMLPLVKNFGGEMAFDTAHAAIQVLGGAGFTKDYPVEQYLRDARVFTIYEGTTGMQGQDFLLRQSLAEDGRALELFLARARAECEGHDRQLAVIERFAAFAEEVRKIDDRERLLGLADAFLRAGWVAVQAWLSVRIAGSEAERFFMARAMAELELHIAAAGG